MIDERDAARGSEAGRALLRAARPPVVPEALRSGVRRAVEARVAAGDRRSAGGRLALALVGSVLAGSALAYAVVQLRTGARPVIERAPRVERTPPAARAMWMSVPTPVDAPRAAPAPRGARARRVARALPLLVPEHAGPPGLWPSDDLEPPGPVPAPPRLVIRREGRPDVAMVLAGDRVVGQVGTTAVSFTLSAAQLVGRLGDRNVWLWLHGHAAEGYIGGAPVRFELAETPSGQELREGFILHGSLPAHAARLAATDQALSWSPGCGAALAQVGAGVYQGRCRRGGEARVAIPAHWQRLSSLPRLILLSFFLTERDPRFEPLFP